jgi:hypothetical protein
MGPTIRQSVSRQAWVDAPFQNVFDDPAPGREAYSGGGMQPFTEMYMGGLHPRAKQVTSASGMIYL